MRQTAGRTPASGKMAIISEKILALLLVTAIFLTTYIETAYAKEEKKLRVLCTFFPLKVFTLNVAKGAQNVVIETLLPPNRGPHNYSLSPGDVRKIVRADIYLANGLGLESFLERPIKNINPKLKIFILTRGIKPIPIGAGSETQHDIHRGIFGIPGEYNEHAWVSPLQAIKYVMNIRDSLIKIDEPNSHLYIKNAEEYISKLRSLYEETRQAVKTFKSTKIVTQHRAFDYYARDVGLEIVAVLLEVPGQEPSAGKLAKLIRKIKASGAAAVFGEPQFSMALAKTIAKETRLPLGILDPAATGEVSMDAYEKIMKKNIVELRRILGEKNEQRRESRLFERSHQI